MSIIQTTRWKSGERGEVLQAAKAAKDLAEKYGGEFISFSRYYTGPYVGEWLFAIRYPDWEAYAIVQQAQANDGSTMHSCLSLAQWQS
jgi:hypothetical protein